MQSLTLKKETNEQARTVGKGTQCQSRGYCAATNGSTKEKEKEYRKGWTERGIYSHQQGYLHSMLHPYYFILPHDRW